MGLYCLPRAAGKSATDWVHLCNRNSSSPRLEALVWNQGVERWVLLEALRESPFLASSNVWIFQPP